MSSVRRCQRNDVTVTARTNKCMRTRTSTRFLNVVRGPANQLSRPRGRVDLSRCRFRTFSRTSPDVRSVDLNAVVLNPRAFFLNFFLSGAKRNRFEMSARFIWCAQKPERKQIYIFIYRNTIFRDFSTVDKELGVVRRRLSCYDIEQTIISLCRCGISVRFDEFIKQYHNISIKHFSTA